ncbi:solute carrier family 22 member 4 [Aplysia californica]|uniref:Solute carrier family 22 member 4 n=1 Tax=Aplysia californica TaxID=6500 RepID=A0ABM0JJA2_APLCA|nr:solute carrier family 22 member 4 [Aplysia californica]
MFGTIENVTQIANKSLDTSTSKEELDSAAVTSTTTRLLSWSTGDLAERYNLTTISAPTTTTTHSSCEKTFMLLSRELEKTEILSGLGIRELHQLLSYTQGAGVIIGAGLGSMVADIYGRRRILYTSLSVMLVFHCLVALSISWVMFIFLRVVAAASAGATLVVSFVMVIEYLGPDWRDACTCSCLWTLGAILLSLEALVTSHWRWMALISGGIGLPLIGTFFTSHESVRWLQCQHRFTEAESGFREVISVNAGAVPDIMALLDHSRACIVNNMHQKKFTFIDLFHSIDSTKWTITLVYTCLISSCVYFCLLWRVRHITGSVYIDGFLPFLVDLPLTWSVIIVNRW